MSERTLEIRDVGLTFAGVVALDGVGFRVEPGSIHALIGPNGAGKTSCFNVISGIYRPQRGQVLLGDQELIGLRPHVIARSGVARAFQNIAVSPTQSVRSNLLVGRYALTRSGILATGLRLPRARREAGESEQRVEQVADVLGLTSMLEQPAGLLSYGDRKRLELGRALVMDPDVVLLDEPVAGMNDEETARTAEVIRTARAEFGMSVLLVEHDMTLVMALADRITVLDFGRLLADGTPDEVTRNERVMAAYLGTEPMVEADDGGTRTHSTTEVRS